MYLLRYLAYLIIMWHICNGSPMEGANLAALEDSDYAYADDGMDEDSELLQSLESPLSNNLQDFYPMDKIARLAAEPSTAAPVVAASDAPPADAATTAAASASAAAAAPAGGGGGEGEAKTKELQALIQHLYVAQARVQLEANEIKKAQAVASSAQQALEEATNHVQAVSAAIITAQQEVAAAAIRAQTAQLQLAAHDQLLFAARQDVDSLSSQMVGLQAAEGITGPKVSFDINALLEKLRQPLADSEKPTAITPIVPVPAAYTRAPGKTEREAPPLEEFEYIQ